MIRDGWFAIGRHWRVRAEPGSSAMLEDGRLMVRGTYRGTSRRAAKPVEALFVHVVTFRDGLIAEVFEYYGEQAHEGLLRRLGLVA